MMPRFLDVNQLVRHSALALVVLAASPWSFAGSKDDFNRPPGGGGGGGGDRDPRPPRGGGGSGGDFDNSQVDRSAVVGVCGWAGSLPRSQPYDREGYLSLAWQEINIGRYSWSRSYASSSYKDPFCEMFALQMIRRDSNGLARFRDRCEAIRHDLISETQGDNGSANVGDFSAMDAFLGGGSSGGGDYDAGGSNCDDLDVLSGHERFACKAMEARDLRESPNSRKDLAKSILSECTKAGADMRKRLSQYEYNSYANSGVHYQGGYCGGGGGAGGGVVVIQNQKSKLQTITDGLLGAIKIAAPLWVMNDANKRLNQTTQMSIQGTHALGFPTATYAGTNIGGIGGHGGMYGGGGFGYTGHGGACPYGQCGGNGGIMVGAGGFGGGLGGGIGGGVMGGTCGVPPYAPWSGQFGGCGMGMGGAGAGGNPWLNGGAAGRFPGSVYTGGTPGFYGPGGPGLGGSGFGGGGFGGGGFGGLTGNTAGMPGALGTLNGGNGWGGPGAHMGQWGPGGTYGAPAFYGSGAGGYDAQQATLMAQQMQQYAQTIQRQAEQASKAQTNYAEDLAALQRTYGKSYQSWMAAQTASAGLNGLGGMGTGFGGFNSGYQQGYTGGGMYYPPYSSGGGSGLGLNLNLNYQQIRR